MARRIGRGRGRSGRIVNQWFCVTGGNGYFNRPFTCLVGAAGRLVIPMIQFRPVTPASADLSAAVVEQSVEVNQILGSVDLTDTTPFAAEQSDRVNFAFGIYLARWDDLAASFSQQSCFGGVAGAGDANRTNWLHFDVRGMNVPATGTSGGPNNLLSHFRVNLRRKLLISPGTSLNMVIETSPNSQGTSLNGFVNLRLRLDKTIA